MTRSPNSNSGRPLDQTTLRMSAEVLQKHEGNLSGAARELGISRAALRKRVDRYTEQAVKKLESLGYDVARGPMSAQEAWESGLDATERRLSDIISRRWRTIQRPKGPFVVYHSTDEHVDDDATPLRLIEDDIRAAHDMNAVMCHGGDLLNNWPLAGKLAKQWAEQTATRPVALLRAQHFIGLFRPNVWTMGNHEEMNPYLADILAGWLPETCLTDYWTVQFRVETPGGRPVRCVLSHKFQKGSSWFHKAHGHIREMLEGEEADVLMDGHLHSDGVLDHTLPERGHSALCVASAGYKIVDQYAMRISRGGKVPKLRGRAHWIVCDPGAELDGNLAVAFKDPDQARAYFNGLQNLRMV